MGDDVPRHRARRRARRGGRPHRRLAHVALQQAVGSSRRSTPTSPRAAPTAAAVPQRRRRRRRLRPADGLARRPADRRPSPGRPDLTRAMALVAVASAMYGEVLWPQLSAALAGAQSGDGSGLLALYDGYYQRNPDGTWSNALEAFRADQLHGHPDRPTVEEQDRRLGADAGGGAAGRPRHHRVLLCTFFPPPGPPRVASPAPAPGRSSSAASPGPGDPARRAPGRWPRRWRTGGSSWSRRPAHLLRRTNAPTT